MTIEEAAREYAEAVHAERRAREIKSAAETEIHELRQHLNACRARLNLAKEAVVACALAESKQVVA